LGLWIWEHLGIENEITPMESSQPKAIEMEYFNRYISCLHAFEERINCLFIVICGEAGAKPKPMAPAGDLSGLAGQD
jgi:hypothetical protein